MGERPSSSRECICPGLVERIGLGQPPLLPSGSDVGQDCPGPSNSACVPTDVDQSAMVGEASEYALGTPPHCQRGGVISRPSRTASTRTGLGNPFHGCQRLIGADLSRRLRALEHRGDIPVGQRLQWLEENAYKVLTPLGLRQMAMCRVRLSKQSKQPRYPLFFTIKTMVHWAVDGVLVGPSLLDQVITQLRLLTMMRSSDVANLMSGIRSFQDIFLVRTTDKGGLERYFNVGGICLHSLCKYMVQHVQSPAPHLLRYLDRPNQCLGSERVAKRFLGVLNQHGVDTTIFKAHSLRGAVATFLLQSGVPKVGCDAVGVGVMCRP